VGSEVVDAVIGKIRFFLKERSDYEFLRRIAAVETNFGLQTPANSNGGIWQVSIERINAFVYNMVQQSFRNRTVFAWFRNAEPAHSR